LKGYEDKKGAVSQEQIPEVPQNRCSHFGKESEAANLLTFLCAHAHLNQRQNVRMTQKNWFFIKVVYQNGEITISPISCCFSRTLIAFT